MGLCETARGRGNGSPSPTLGTSPMKRSMLTTVVIGNSTTYSFEGAMVTLSYSNQVQVVVLPVVNIPRCISKKV